MEIMYVCVCRIHNLAEIKNLCSGQWNIIEPAYHAVVGGGPALELLLPLLDGDAGVAEHERALADRAHGRHAHQRLARAARQHDHARPDHTRFGIIVISRNTSTAEQGP